jgi:hypothetical protein
LVSVDRYSEPAVMGQPAAPDDGWEPADVVDRLLWRDAQQILSRHAEPDGTGHCLWCGRAWPCAPRRCAERADAASRRPWNEAWTARHDLYSLRTMPGWRAEIGARSRPRGGWHRANNNRGTFL